MRWNTNTTMMRERSRRASPQPDYSELSVDASSDLETKKSNAPSARLSWLRIIREYTQQHQQQIIVVGSDAWLKKYYLKRLGTPLRGQTRVSQRSVDA